jgi:hypothetical protein
LPALVRKKNIGARVLCNSIVGSDFNKKRVGDRDRDSPANLLEIPPVAVGFGRSPGSVSGFTQNAPE